jgi:hypothetical protein
VLSAAVSRAQEKYPHYHAFLSHAGEQKKTLVAHLRAALTRDHPKLRPFVDEWSLKVGDNAPQHMDVACETCDAGAFNNPTLDVGCSAMQRCRQAGTLAVDLCTLLLQLP